MGTRAEAGRAARRLLLELRLTPGLGSLLKVDPTVLLTDRMQDEREESGETEVFGLSGGGAIMSATDLSLPGRPSSSFLPSLSPSPFSLQPSHQGRAHLAWPSPQAPDRSQLPPAPTSSHQLPPARCPAKGPGVSLPNQQAPSASSSKCFGGDMTAETKATQRTACPLTQVVPNQKGTSAGPAGVELKQLREYQGFPLPQGREAFLGEEAFKLGLKGSRLRPAGRREKGELEHKCEARQVFGEEPGAPRSHWEVRLERQVGARFQST